MPTKGAGKQPAWLKNVASFLGPRQNKDTLKARIDEARLPWSLFSRKWDDRHACATCTQTPAPRPRRSRSTSRSSTRMTTLRRCGPFDASAAFRGAAEAAVERRGSREQGSKCRCFRRRPVAQAIAQRGILRHKDPNIRLMAACSLADVMRLFAPDPPFDNDTIEEIFGLFIDQLSGLADTESSSYPKYFYLLESLAMVQTFLLLVDGGGPSSPAPARLAPRLWVQRRIRRGR